MDARWDWTREASPVTFVTGLVLKHVSLGFLRTGHQAYVSHGWAHRNRSCVLALPASSN